MSIQAMEDILIKLQNILEVDKDFLTEDDCLTVETFIVQFKTLETKLETAELNRVNLRDYILKDYDMTNSFIDGVNDVIDNRTDNPSDELRDLEDKVSELENQVESQPDIYDIEDKIQDVVDSVIDDLRITRG